MVTKNVESAISSVSGVDTVTSQSSEGTSIVMVSFASGTDMDEATNDMKDNLEMYDSILPDDANDPMVVQINSNMMPVAMMNATIEGYDLVQTNLKGPRHAGRARLHPVHPRQGGAGDL